MARVSGQPCGELYRVIDWARLSVQRRAIRRFVNQGLLPRRSGADSRRARRERVTREKGRHIRQDRRHLIKSRVQGKDHGRVRQSGTSHASGRHPRPGGPVFKRINGRLSTSRRRARRRRENDLRGASMPPYPRRTRRLTIPGIKLSRHPRVQLQGRQVRALTVGAPGTNYQRVIEVCRHVRGLTRFRELRRRSGDNGRSHSITPSTSWRRRRTGCEVGSWCITKRGHPIRATSGRRGRGPPRRARARIFAFLHLVIVLGGGTRSRRRKRGHMDFPKGRGGRYFPCSFVRHLRGDQEDYQRIVGVGVFSII